MKYHDFKNVGEVYGNLTTGALYEEILKRREGLCAHKGPIVVRTGHHRGLPREDKFVVKEPSSEKHVWWGRENHPFDEERFESLYNRLKAYLQGKDIFVQDCLAGADPKLQVPIRIISESAWHSLYARNMFVRIKDMEALKNHRPECTIINVPRFHALPEFDGTHSEAFVIVNFGKKMILIGGTSYAGEIKRSAFTVLNYAFLSEENILPMHCAVNSGAGGNDDVAIFFGLSGTGKTALSMSPDRRLIGNDEHGWSDNGVFNFEGGCYSRLARITAESNPFIFQCTEQFGTILENVSIDTESRRVDLADTTLTDNTRAAYPISQIENSVASGMGGHPRNIFMLTCDATGVMPPVAKLSSDQAIYYYLCGYTSKISSGKPIPTFNPCFGAPFLALSPLVYARILGEKIAHHQVNCWLVNTGWTGGPYGVGRRIEIKASRAIVKAILTGRMDHVSMRQDPIFGFEVPESCEGISPETMDPKKTWKDTSTYDVQARELVMKFKAHMEKFSSDLPKEVIRSGP